MALSTLISPYQSSFITGRQSTDNFIACQEVIHSLSKKKGNKGGMVIKLDLEKTYDRMEWSFVQNTLIDAGLLSSLIRVIMNCVT